MDLSFEMLYDGMEFSARINEIPCVGKIALFDGGVYLCQNVKSGAYCVRNKRHGYDFSWAILTKNCYKKTIERALKQNHVSEFKILNRRKNRITEFYNKK